MIYFILDNIYNESIANGIFIGYKSFIARLIAEKYSVTLITRYVKDAQIPKGLTVQYTSFIQIPMYNELYVPPLQLENGLIDFTSNPTVFTLVEYGFLLPQLLLYRQMHNFKLILGYHTNMDFYAKYYNLSWLVNILKQIPSYIKEDILILSGHSSKEMIEPSRELLIWYDISPHFLKSEPIIPVYNNSDPINMIYLGRISNPQKNVFELKDIYDKLIVTNNQIVKLTIYGNGPDLTAMKKLFGDNKNVQFKGIIQSESIYHMYKSLVNPIFVNPSTSETLGKSTIEATIVGIPVFTRRSIETPLLYKSGENGYIYYNVFDCCAKINIFLKANLSEKKRIICNGHNLRDKFQKDLYDIIQPHLD